MITEYYKSIQSIEHSESDFIHFMKQVDNDSISDPYLVYATFNGRKDIRRFNSMAKAENYFQLLSDLYFFSIDEVLDHPRDWDEQNDPIGF